jgi:stage V sporulation protein G
MYRVEKCRNSLSCTNIFKKTFFLSTKKKDFPSCCGNIQQVLLKKKVVNVNVQITDVRLRRVNSEGRMKAIASITIDNEFVVHDIRVIDGNNGMFVAMPSKRTPDGEFRDIAHPISSATREKIQAAVLAEYERAAVEEEVMEEGA